MSSMTLEQVLSWHRSREKVLMGVNSVAHKSMADAIDAHLTQPAQSVDVECLRDIVKGWESRAYKERRRIGEYPAGLAHAYEACSEDLSDKLTAAMLITEKTP